MISKSLARFLDIFNLSYNFCQLNLDDSWGASRFTQKSSSDTSSPLVMEVVVPIKGFRLLEDN